jgi:cell division protein FtsB
VRLEHLFTSLLASVAAALVTALLVSHYAPAGYDKLEAYASRLEANIAELETKRAELVAQAELYQSNRDAVIVEARELGYVAENQRVIRLDAPTRDRLQSPGTLLQGRPLPESRRGVTRVVTAVVFVLSLLMQFAGAHDSSEMRRASR